MTSKEKEEEKDRLSALPDSILIHILSFLPTKEAIRTVLIRRFGTLWKFLPSLNLDDRDLVELWNYEEDDSSPLNHGFFQFIRNVLMLHQRPTIDKFIVNIGTMFNSDIQRENLGHEIDSCITFALRKKVKIFEFGFGMVEPEEMFDKFPLPDFVSDSLIELKLEFVEMKLQRRVEMSSLRVLRLIRVTLNDHVFGKIIHFCPLLKELEISNCWDLCELNFSAANLEKLILENYESTMDTMRINCPQLSSLYFTGCVDNMEVMNISSLVDVAFILQCSSMEFREFAQFNSILSKILHAKTVRLSSEFVTVLFYCMQKFHQNLSIKWKQLELNIWLTDRHITGICCLLRSSPDLEELVLDVVGWHSDFLEPIELELDNEVLKEQESWSCLKRVVIRGNLKSSYDIVVRLVEILLKNASVLNELVIFSKGNVETSNEDFELKSDQQMEFSEKLLRFPRSSKHATVLLS